MVSIFNKLRSFPEVAELQQTLNRMNNAEQKIARSMHSAFQAFPRYNLMQKNLPNLYQSLNELTIIGLNLSQVVDTHSKQIENFPAKYNSLDQIHSEMKNWLIVRNNAKNQAEKSQEIASQAKLLLDKAKMGNNQVQIDKAQSNYVVAIRKAEMDTESFKDTEKYFKQATSPFKQTFIDDFTKTTNEYLEMKMKFAREQRNLCDRLDRIVETFVEFEDPNMSFYRKFYHELEQIEQEGFLDENREDTNSE